VVRGAGANSNLHDEELKSDSSNLVDESLSEKEQLQVLHAGLNLGMIARILRDPEHLKLDLDATDWVAVAEGVAASDGATPDLRQTVRKRRAEAVPQFLVPSAATSYLQAICMGAANTLGVHVCGGLQWLHMQAPAHRSELYIAIFGKMARYHVSTQSDLSY
jgi:hypothetical protein